MFTERKTHAEAVLECQEIRGLGEAWCENANRYYSLAPNGPKNNSEILELVNLMEQLANYDYDNIRLTITGNDSRSLIAYKPNPSVNMRTVDTIRDQDRDNLVILKRFMATDQTVNHQH